MKKQCKPCSLAGIETSVTTKICKSVNPFEERISYINFCKAVIPFFDMHFSTLVTAIVIFQAITNGKSINEITWENFIKVGAGNTRVNIGRHTSLLAKLIKKQNCMDLMGCS